METQEERQAAPDEQPSDEERAQLSSAAVNDLPDSAFAYIEPGGKKDDEGKTTPRSLRHFPIHDEAHVRNALARMSQSPFGDKAKPKILAAAKKFGIEVSQNNSAKRPVVKRRGRARAVPLLPEVRHFRATELEVREDSKSDQLVISGSPIVYNADYSVTDMFGEFTERMMPGVARNVLDNQPDVRFLFNHDGLPLARTVAGTLSLQDSDEALRFTAALDSRQQLANDLAIAIERGDISQMSCGFVVARDEWDDRMEDRSIWELADLLDVSAVTYPASPTTSIAVAKRMALEVPVESRARLRRVYADLREGKPIAPERAIALRTVLDAALDPGDDLETPDGTGRLGRPEGDGPVYADPGNDAPADGTEGASTSDMAGGPSQDGTGSRDAEPEAETPERKTLRATRLRVKRAARGL